jgi:heme/copper-type cytochrome/quinol oxidase subunit 3
MTVAPVELELRTRTPTGRPNGWWGMVLLIATEATLFAVLIASYFYLRFESAPEWPPDGIAAPKLLLPSVMTALLVASSIPMWWAARAIERGRTRQLEAGLLGSFFLGTLFLLVQALEFLDKLDRFKPQTDAYASMFFTITGLHAAHVAVGLLLTLWTAVYAARGSFSTRWHTTVRTTALYWHFMPAVWIVIFLALYVSPRA